MNITARMTEIPVPIATQPIVEVEKLFVVTGPFLDLVAIHTEIGNSRPTARVTCVWAGVDNAWKQDAKWLEATLREMLENRADSHTSGARFVRRCLMI